MSKTKEELDAIKEEVETVNKKLQELTDEELEKVVGGINPSAVMPIIFAQPFMQISPQIDR